MKSIRDEEEKLMVNAWYSLVSKSAVSYCMVYLSLFCRQEN